MIPRCRNNATQKETEMKVNLEQSDLNILWTALDLYEKRILKIKEESMNKELDPFFDGTLEDLKIVERKLNNT